MLGRGGGVVITISVVSGGIRRNLMLNSRPKKICYRKVNDEKVSLLTESQQLEGMHRD